MKTAPLISIFIPYYNDEKTLPSTIRSVLGQTYRNFELILFNHASTDASREIAHSFDDPRIIHLSGEINYGAGAGINFWEALPAMKGEYVKIFCADDCMLPNHLEDLSSKLSESPALDFVVSPRLLFIDSQDNLMKESSYVVPKEILSDPNLSLALLKSYFDLCSVLPWGNGLVRKKVLDNIPCKDNSMIYLFDMSFWVNLLLSGATVGFVDKDITLYRKSSANLLAVAGEKLHQTCFFEGLVFLRLFFNVQDVSIAKELCQNVPVDIKEKIAETDTHLIPFLIALEYAYKKIKVYQKYPVMALLYPIVSYEKLYSLLQDESMRKILKEKFNFTIKEFRELYTSLSYRHLFRKERKIDRLLKKCI